MKLQHPNESNLHLLCFNVTVFLVPKSFCLFYFHHRETGNTKREFDAKNVSGWGCGGGGVVHEAEKVGGE